MNISVIGTGYVGIVTAACFAEFGMKVVSADIDKEKIDKLKNYIIPIYEPGLEYIVKRNCERGYLAFTTSLKETVEHADIIFICVGTPALKNGMTDIQYVLDAAKEIALYMKSYKTIVNKSTVPVGTGRKVKTLIQNTLLERNESIYFDVVSNPEFLKEGTAVEDFFKPDRIVIGTDSTKAASVMKEIYNIHILLSIPFIITDIETAEMIKYASNAFLANKISFINEIANLCELCNADIVTVSKAMGLDKRIGNQFLNAGPGFGGSCLPKDVKSLLSTGKSFGYTPSIIKSIMDVNELQKRMVLNKIEKSAGGLQNKTVTVLGLAFKPETDDIRESPAIEVISELVKRGAKVKVYDPKAMPNTKIIHPDLRINYCSTVGLASRNSDCIVLFTEWKQFSSIDFTRLKLIVNTPVLVDLRNMYNPEDIKKAGFKYQGVGRK